jgi:hypothetical protein
MRTAAAASGLDGLSSHPCKAGLTITLATRAKREHFEWLVVMPRPGAANVAGATLRPESAPKRRGDRSDQSKRQYDTRHQHAEAQDRERKHDDERRKRQEQCRSIRGPADHRAHVPIYVDATRPDDTGPRGWCCVVVASSARFSRKAGAAAGHALALHWSIQVCDDTAVPTIACVGLMILGLLLILGSRAIADAFNASGDTSTPTKFLGLGDNYQSRLYRWATTVLTGLVFLVAGVAGLLY